METGAIHLHFSVFKLKNFTIWTSLVLSNSWSQDHCSWRESKSISIFFGDFSTKRCAQGLWKWLQYGNRKQSGLAKRGTPWRFPQGTSLPFFTIFRSVMCALPAKTASGFKKSARMGRPNLITAGSRRCFAERLPCAGDRKGVLSSCPQVATTRRSKFVPAIRAKDLWTG